MHVHFVRTGGFAGLQVKTDIDSADLPADEASALLQDIENADFFSLPAEMTAKGEVDRFQYTISVEAEGKKHTIEVSEPAMPDSLRPLVRRLELLWRMHRGK
jgi:hypothetical protein